MPLLFLVALLLYLIIGVMVEDTPKKDKFTICGFDENKTQEVLTQNYSSTYQISDYFYYGESLNLLTTPHNPTQVDALIGKTIILHNLCSNEDFSFTVEKKIDRQIATYELTPGFYEVYAIDNLERKRVVYQGELENHDFSTIIRDGKIKQFDLLAHKNLLQDYETTLPKNYLFIGVQEKEPIPDEIDVLLDPYGYNIDVTYLPDLGSQKGSVIENDEMYEAALNLKRELEAKGLRVAITKEKKDQEIMTYGKDGRLYKGYEQKAKYYLLLRFSESENSNTKGMEIIHSSYASSSQANTILYEMKKNSNIVPSNALASDPNNPGVFMSLLIPGKDGRMIYDTNLNIREAGGKATNAGMFSENSEQQNGFAKNNNLGMNSLEIDFIYITNQSDLQNWEKNKQKIVKSFAEAWLKSIRLGKSNE